MARPQSARTTLAILTGLNFLNYVDRYVPAAVLPSIKKALLLSDAQLGSLQSLFMLTYVLVSPLAGWLGDRRPRFQLAAAGVFVWSAATFGSGLAPTFLALVLARALTGAGEASYTVVTPSLLSDFYPASRRGRALAIFYAAIPVGSAIGYVLGGEIDHRLGWRWAFFVAGLPGAALAFLLLFLREPPRGALDPERKATPTPAASAGAFPGLKAVAGRRSFIYNTAAQTIYTFTLGGLAFWMPTYFERIRHLESVVATRSFGGVVLLAGFVGTLIGGRLGDRMAQRAPAGHFTLAGWALVASLPFTLLGILSPVPAIFWPSMFVTLSLLFLNTGPLNAAMANVLPAHLRGTGFAVNTVAIHILGDAISPPLIGLASDRWGLGLPVLITGSLLVVAGVLLLAGRKALASDLAAVSA